MTTAHISLYFRNDGVIQFARLVDETGIRTWKLASDKVIGDRNEAGIKAIRKILAKGAAYGTGHSYPVSNLVPEAEAMEYLGVGA